MQDVELKESTPTVEPATLMDLALDPLSKLAIVRDQFQFYAHQHESKAGDPDRSEEQRVDALHKCDVNIAMAKQVDGIISSLLVTGDSEYHGLAMRTAAGPEVFHPHNYEVRDLAVCLAKYIVAARHLDAAKSALFYGERKVVVTDDVSSILASGGTSGTFDYDFIRNPQFLHATLGILSEGGEIADDVLLALQGELDSIDNLVRETGDIDWFQELLAEVTSVSVTTARQENIDRLRRRYPDKFTEDAAIARADEQEIIAIPMTGPDAVEGGGAGQG